MNAKTNIEYLPGGLVVLSRNRDELLVVKPKGVASELTDDPRRTSVISILSDRFQDFEPRLVHRLDRVARGLMLVALNREAAAFHNQEIQEGRVEKYYLAKTHAPINGSLQALIRNHKAFLKKDQNKAKIVRSGGKVSLLEILAASEAPSFPRELHVLIRLISGRFHQIRVMLAHLGIPLVGDDLYNSSLQRQSDNRSSPFDDFYLEHIVLKYRDFETRQKQTAFFCADPDRLKIGPPIEELIKKIANT